jgi:hypothetical protein
MYAEDTLDPALVTTRKMESMSDLVAEMVLGACDEDDDAAADAAALAAARRVAVKPDCVAPPASAAAPPAPVMVAEIAQEPSRRRPIIGMVAALGLLALTASAGITFLVLR